MKKSKIKYQFSIKSEAELDKLSHDKLLEYIKNLQKNIVQEKPPKNPNNSSMPSSTDIAESKKPKKNQSLRKESDKDVGGQKSRVGVTLLQSDIPDEVKNVEFNITECKKCGVDISDIDETGCRVDGKRNWHWTFQDDRNTLIVANSSRGRVVISDTFENGFKWCVVHDNYSSYSKISCEVEQLCLAHKLRDLNYAIECDDTKLMKDIKTLLKEAIKDDNPLCQESCPNL